MRTFEDYFQVAKYTAEDRFLSSQNKLARDTIYSFDSPIIRGAIFSWALGRLDSVNWKQAFVDLLLISGSNLSTGMMGLAMGGDVCPGCGTSNPTLLRSTGNIVDDTILPENVGIDGLSTYCQTCGNNIKPGKTYWPLTVEDLRAFSESINLNPDQAANYTPQFGGQGHWSLFTDAYQPDGQLMPNVAAAIDQFVRSFSKVKIR